MLAPQGDVDEQAGNFPQVLGGQSQLQYEILGKADREGHENSDGEKSPIPSAAVQCDDLNAPLIKKCLKYKVAPEADGWRVPLALELKDIRDGKFNLEYFSKNEILEMLVSVCLL